MLEYKYIYVTIVSISIILSKNTNYYQEIYDLKKYNIVETSILNILESNINDNEFKTMIGSLENLFEIFIFPYIILDHRMRIKIYNIDTKSILYNTHIKNE